jgi:hypothetical protein
MPEIDLERGIAGGIRGSNKNNNDLLNSKSYYKILGFRKMVLSLPYPVFVFSIPVSQLSGRPCLSPC